MDVTQKMRLLFEGGFYSRAAFIQDFTVYMISSDFTKFRPADISATQLSSIDNLVEANWHT